MYALLSAHFISILLCIFSITVFLNLEIFRIILGSLIDKQKLLIKSVLHRDECTAVRPGYQTLAVPGSLL